MNILIITDAWHPQINGVVRTLEATALELEKMGHVVKVIGPENHRITSFCLPSYPEIKIEFFAHKRLAQEIETFAPRVIHIATEGPLGWAARTLCLQQKRPFTTAYHTRFPEYLAARGPRCLKLTIASLGYVVLRRFHAPSNAVMVPTASIENDLKFRYFNNLVLWPRGVDTNLFKPYGKTCASYEGLPRPILLYVGRVAVEKNLRDFLELKTDGTHVVIGDGPDLPLLKREFPKAHFLGILQGETLARHFAAADVFVFPSTTDTFGLALLEACACGLRIASYPASGPVDLFVNKEARQFAVLNRNLQTALDGALRLPEKPNVPRRFAERFSWEMCTRQFLKNTAKIPNEPNVT